MLKRLFLSILAASVAAFLLFGVASCSCERSIDDRPQEAFDEAKPYALLLRSERSYHQARRIMRRLRTMNIDAYVVSDSDADGEWYRVVCGAFPTDSAMQVYQTWLTDTLQLTADSVLDYRLLDSASRVPLVANKVQEVEMIEAEAPALSDTLARILTQYPRNELSRCATSAFYASANVFRKSRIRSVWICPVALRWGGWRSGA